MRKYLFLALLVWAMLEAKFAVAAGMEGEFYSEQSYQERERAIINSTRFRLGQPLTSSTFAYLQLGSEWMSLDAGLKKIDPGSSYAYFAPGIRYAWGPVALHAQVRGRKFYQSPAPGQADFPSIDARGLLVYGQFFTLAQRSQVSLFTETYAELLLTSADSTNLILSTFARFGVRYSPASWMNLDLFGEPFLALDRVGHYYNNRVDFKPSVRIGFSGKAFQAGVTGSYLMNHYFPFGSFEANPYLDRTSGVRVLATLGVSL